MSDVVPVTGQTDGSQNCTMPRPYCRVGERCNNSLLSDGKALCIGRCVMLACEGTANPLLCPRPLPSPEGPAAAVCGGVPKLMLTFGSSAFRPSCQSRHMNMSLGCC